MRCLGNTAYCNSFTAGEMLALGCDRVLVEVLNGDDIMNSPGIVFTALATLSNLCYGESTQSHIGSAEGVVDTAIRILDYGLHTLVVGEAAMLLLATMWKNLGNKILVAGKNAIPVLVKRIISHSEISDEENMDCLEKCCAGT